MDDSLAILDAIANIDQIIGILNSFNKNIVFTYEEEKGKSIPFLDINISRQTQTHNQNQSSFTTKIYRKPTYTGLILKWNSFVPKSYKKSVVGSMVYRAIKICSSYALIHNEIETIKQITKRNRYPEKFVNAQIRNTLGRYLDKENNTDFYKKKPEPTLNEQEKQQVFINIPYIGKHTEKLGNKIDPKINVQPIPTPPPAITRYFNTKDPIPNDLQLNFIYQINCSECHTSYIGKTIRHACQRIKEHKYDAETST